MQTAVCEHRSEQSSRDIGHVIFILVILLLIAVLPTERRSPWTAYYYSCRASYLLIIFRYRPILVAVCCSLYSYMRFVKQFTLFALRSRMQRVIHKAVIRTLFRGCFSPVHSVSFLPVLFPSVSSASGGYSDRAKGFGGSLLINGREHYLHLVVLEMDFLFRPL